MLKNQLKALMSAYNDLVPVVNKFEAIIDTAGGYIDIVQAQETTKQNCVLCKYFNEAMGELCTVASPPARPPARVIVTGCQAFEHKDYDEQDAKDKEEQRKKFLRDLDDTIPF